MNNDGGRRSGERRRARARVALAGVVLALYPTASMAASCPDEPWLTYGHDARRSFAAPGCVRGPLRTVWRYTPALPLPSAPADYQVIALFHAIAEPGAVFLSI